MKTIVSSNQMKELDRRTIESCGVPSCVLMERAALAVLEELRPLLTSSDRILVACGSGNNGGDGFAIARLLHLSGVSVSLWFVGSEEHLTEECRRQREIAHKYGVPEVSEPNLSEYSVIVDAIFGVGLSRPIVGRYASILGEIQAAGAKIVAVDIPSGIHGDTGEVMSAALKADLTVTFGYRKRGMCLYPGRAYCGTIAVKDVGIYDIEKEVSAYALEPEDLRTLPKRAAGGHKGTFGKVLVVAGSEGMCGAAFLSASGALKTGAGMVQIQTAEANRVPLQILLPEAMVSTDFSEEKNERLFAWSDGVVLGPGLSTNAESKAKALWYLKRCKEIRKPLVIDADGLNLLARHPEWQAFLGDHTVLTPHMGEFGRLVNRPVSELSGSYVCAAEQFAKTTGSVVVCKDACTVTADPSGTLYFNLSGNDGMATAGSGDVLSGIIAGMLSMVRQDSTAFARAAAFGVYLHGLAGDAAALKKGRHSMTARDLLDGIADVLIRES